MLVYVLMIIVCSFCGFIIDHNKKEKNILILLIAFTSLFLVSALRYGVGRDYFDTYVFTFNKILNGAESVRSDIGFLLLNKLIIFFGGSYQWVFVITSLIINYFVCKTILQQSKSKFLSLFIYICGTFYFFSLNGIRQSIAISLFYYSLKHIKNKNWKKYFLINMCGFLFHNSAIIFLPLYFILNKKVKSKYKVTAIILVSLLTPIIVSLAFQLLINTKYSIYINNGAFNPLASLNASSILNILLFILYEWKAKKQTEYNTIYSNIHFVGIIISLFLTTIPLALRIFMSFRYIEFLSVPNLIENLSKNKNKMIFKLATVVIYFAYFIYGVFIMNGNSVLPYVTIFGK